MAAVILIAFLLLPLLVKISRVVWLPDVVFSHSWNYVGGTALPDGGEVGIFQIWGSDFYVTAVITRDAHGTNRAHVIDGDDSKEWGSKIDVDTEAKRAMLSINGNRSYYYEWESAKLSVVGEGDGAYEPYSESEFIASFGSFPMKD